METVGKLMSEFPQHKFEFGKPPRFVQELINITQNIILCYNNIQEKTISSVQDESATISTFTEASTCEGSPLELPSCMNISLLSLTLKDTTKPLVRHICNYSPLTSHQALRIKGFYNLKLKSSVPLVILCEGEVKSVQNNQFKSVNRVIQCCYLSDAWKTTCWGDYYKMDSSCVESLGQLRENHFKKAATPNGKKGNCDVQLRSKSVLTSIDDVNDISEKCCTIAVQFEWNSLSVKPPLDNTQVSLIVDICLNKAPSESLSIIWRQLELLQQYIDYLDSGGKGDSNNSSLPSAKSLVEFGFGNSELNEDTVDVEMLKLLCRDVDCLPFISTKENITVSKLTDFFANPNGPPSDLTNSLWTKLVGCESYELLQMCFKHFFKHVGATESKLIKKSNITRLAHMIQAEQMVLDSYLQIINPVEFLLEIGLEKLRQVLLAIVDCMKVSHSFINVPTLPKFPQVANRDEWMKVAKSWLTWLSRLYASLNILCSVEMALGNPQLNTFFPVVCDVMSQLCSNKKESAVRIDSLVDLIDNPQHVALKIPMSLLNTSSVDTEFFEEWSLTLTSTNKSRKVTSIFYRSPSCPIPYINDENPSDESDLNNATQLSSTIGGNTVLCSNNITACLDNLTCTLHCVETHQISDNFPFLNSQYSSIIK